MWKLKYIHYVKDEYTRLPARAMEQSNLFPRGYYFNLYTHKQLIFVYCYTLVIKLFLLSYTENPEWVIWLKMTQKCVKSESFCPCSDSLWLKRVNDSLEVFCIMIFNWPMNGAIVRQCIYLLLNSMCDSISYSSYAHVYLKGTISDKKSLQIPLEMKKHTLQSQHAPLFLKRTTILTEKRLLIRFHSVDTEPCFSPWENFPKCQA